MNNSIRLAVMVLSIAPIFTEPAIGQVFEDPQQRGGDRTPVWMKLEEIGKEIDWSGEPQRTGGNRTAADIFRAQEEINQKRDNEQLVRRSAEREESRRISHRESMRRTIVGGGEGQLYRRTSDGKTAREAATEIAQIGNEEIVRLIYGNNVPVPESRTIPDLAALFKDSNRNSHLRMDVPKDLADMLLKHMNGDLETSLTPREIRAVLQAFNDILLTRDAKDDSSRRPVLALLQELNSPENEQALVRYLNWATRTSSKVIGVSRDYTDSERQDDVAMAATALIRLWWPEEFYDHQYQKEANHRIGYLETLVPAFAPTSNEELQISYRPAIYADNPFLQPAIDNALQIASGARSKPSGPPAVPDVPRMSNPETGEYSNSSVFDGEEYGPNSWAMRAR